jgi:hypothetical protein
VFEIRGTHGGDCEDHYLVGHDAIAVWQVFTNISEEHAIPVFRIDK